MMIHLNLQSLLFSTVEEAKYPKSATAQPQASPQPHNDGFKDSPKTPPLEGKVTPKNNLFRPRPKLIPRQIEAQAQALQEIKEGLKKYNARFAEYVLVGYYTDENIFSANPQDAPKLRDRYLAQFDEIIAKTATAWQELVANEKSTRHGASPAFAQGVALRKILNAYQACLQVYEICRAQQLKEKELKNQGISYNSAEIWGRFHLEKATQKIREAEQIYFSLLLDLTHLDDAELRAASLFLKSEIESIKIHLETWKEQRPYLVPLLSRKLSN